MRLLLSSFDSPASDVKSAEMSHAKAQRRKGSQRLSGLCAFAPLREIFFALLFATSLTAQEPADLVEARQALLMKALTDSQKVTEQYVLALAARETALAAAGDYEQAKQFQQRRQQLEAIYQGVESTNAVALSLVGTRLMGSAQASGESLGNFRSSGSGVEWSLFRLTPGKYRLEFEANMTDAPVAFASAKLQPQEKAVFEFGEVTGLASTSNNRVSVEIARSADETTFAKVQSAEMTFTRTPLTLRLVAASGYPANILRLRGLKLVPVTEAAPVAQTEAVDAKAALEALRSTLASELAEAQKAVLEAYRTELEQIASKNQNEVKTELKRLERLAEKKDDKPRFSPPRSLADATGHLDGFDEVIEATLADGEPETGDRFTVLHEGRERKVRLLWVVCPPVKSDDKSLSSVATRFRIDTEDALAVGRAAQEFTAGYLRGKKLRLVAKPPREGTDYLEALVFLPEVGLYQNVLIDQGLAALYVPPGNKSGMGENTLLKSLFAREQAAKTRVPPSGAWALSHDNNSKK
jgi:hypothetical protein